MASPPPPHQPAARERTDLDTAMGAADVFAMGDRELPNRPETVPEGLRTHPRTVLTPHLGSAVDALAGRRPAHAVNDVSRS